jgi:hydrogenase maturation factor
MSSPHPVAIDPHEAIMTADREFTAIKRDIGLTCTITLDQAYKMVQLHDRIMVHVKAHIDSLVKNQRELSASLYQMSTELENINKALQGSNLPL